MPQRQVQHSETIFALSSGAVPSGVAIIRISGPQTLPTVELLSGNLPPARALTLRQLRDTDNNDIIDHGMVAVFPAPASFTGEDCAELHIHGSRAIIARLLEFLSSQDNHRLAEAGEFTRRAFMNGKMDLTGAEALADLINAETESQRRLALVNAGGSQQQLYDGWRSEIIQARALIEADLDFADEDDVPGGPPQHLAGRIFALAEKMTAHLKGFAAGEIIRDGFRVVLAGAPNAGKSSLLNALAKREIAIVTPIAGTTRDILEVHLDLDGVKVIVFDTAGLRSSQDAIEAIGVTRAQEAMHRADLIVELKSLAGDEDEQSYHIEAGAEVLGIHSKADLVAAGDLPTDAPAISVVNGSGLDDLIEAIRRRAAAATTIGNAAIPTRQRHKALISGCRNHLLRTADVLDQDLVLAAEELRIAADFLGRLTGRVDVEDILDVVFSQFCIGK